MKADDWDKDATAVMKHYADRGVFRGGMVSERKGGTTSYRIRWHRNRAFVIVLDKSKQTARVTEVLPGIPARSKMYSEYKAFLAEFQDGTRPKHRSVDPKKVTISCDNKAGRVSLALKIKGKDYAYAMKKLLALVHETYMGFVLGPYDDYRVEQLGADPDWGK